MTSRPQPSTESLPPHNRVAHTRRSSTFSSRSSLFDALPLEIQAEIFSYCLPAFPHLGKQNGNDDPLLIAKVCRTWRALVHSTPKLWCAFEIEVQDSLDVRSSYALRLVNIAKLWLERSRQHTLSIRLVHIPKRGVPNPISAQLLALFVLQARRIRRMEFTIPTATLSAVQHLFPQDFPVLKSLTLKTAHSSWQAPGAFDFHALGVPWAQLTELDLRLDHNHILNLDDYVNLLSDASNLAVCKINANFAPGPPPSEEHTPFVLPSLRTLHVILQGTDAGQVPLTPQQRSQTPEVALTSFLSLFSDCRLDELHLNWLVDGRGIENWSTTCDEALIAFFTAQSLSLRSLELTYLPLGQDQLIRCLAQLPELEALRLCFSVSIADQALDPITDDTLSTLTLRKTKMVLRHLRQLHVQCTGVHCTEEVLVKMVDSRCPAGLRRFHFSSVMPVIDRVDVGAHGKRWKNGGVDVVIESFENSLP